MEGGKKITSGGAGSDGAACEAHLRLKLGSACPALRSCALHHVGCPTLFFPFISSSCLCCDKVLHCLCPPPPPPPASPSLLICRREAPPVASSCGTNWEFLKLVGAKPGLLGLEGSCCSTRGNYSPASNQGLVASLLFLTVLFDVSPQV